MIYKNTPPKEWTKRKIIIILDEDKVDMLYESREAEEFVNNPEMCILSLPLNKNDKVVQELIESNLDKEGLILVQNPFYRDRYTEISNIQDFPLGKYLIFTQFCRYLGAKEVKIEEIDIIETNIKKEIKASLEGGGHVSGSVKGIEGGIGSNIKTRMDLIHEKDRELVRNLFLQASFFEGKTDIKAAHKLLEDIPILKNDLQIYHLFQLRNGETNRLQSIQISLNLTKETKELISFISSIGGKIDLLGKILSKIGFSIMFNFSVNLENTLRELEKKEYFLKISLNFGD